MTTTRTRHGSFLIDAAMDMPLPRRASVVVPFDRHRRAHVGTLAHVQTGRSPETSAVAVNRIGH
ncbi:hypothetical protein [Tropicimonas isoalkanivorans]|uniref:Uncharacterized protein n=1 Tax=Tropicimonas isoalkanivorans TaxID=441112 RepID=A0A1I1GBR9_9RHOB|nr:hypothetical protein [Tropicimonas isoalkanivorans]SFC08965.1 hypothetical protein SAMN04488094_102498 [Tropicimonas isoalkanivorans]